MLSIILIVPIIQNTKNTKAPAKNEHKLKAPAVDAKVDTQRHNSIIVVAWQDNNVVKFCFIPFPPLVL
jgi:hypothetical protein